jgi:hypothetical protein
MKTQPITSASKTLVAWWVQKLMPAIGGGSGPELRRMQEGGRVETSGVLDLEELLPGHKGNMGSPDALTDNETDDADSVH